MSDSAITLLLDGMPVGEFFLWLGVGIGGALCYLIFRMINAISTDPETPYHFSWRHTIRGFLKLLVAFMMLPIIIVSFDEVMPWLLKILFALPDGIGVPIELNLFWAFLVGLMMDIGVHKISSKLLKKKNNGD